MDCKICEEECTNIEQIQEHEKEQHDIAAECNVWRLWKNFQKWKKLDDHKGSHAIFVMDDSDKIYMYEGILELKFIPVCLKCKIYEYEDKAKTKLNFIQM